MQECKLIALSCSKPNSKKGKVANVKWVNILDTLYIFHDLSKVSCVTIRIRISGAAQNMHDIEV